MTVSRNRTIAIVGVGSSMSRSLALWLASLGWNIALISRSEKNLSTIADEVKNAQSNKESKVIYRAADAGNPTSLKAALDWCVDQFQSKLDVLNYNAAHVTESDITDLTPEELEADFGVAAVGTLVAGQWFTKNARLDNIQKGERPLLLVTGGALDKDPQPIFSSLSTVKAASQTVSRLFAKTLPEKFNIMVGMPLVSGRIVDPVTGKYIDGFHPTDIIQKVFKPFFEDRERVFDGTESWKVERLL